MTHHITDEQIRAVFLANGFTIKDGHTDLKPYVYAAARAVLALAAPAPAVPELHRDQIIDLISPMSKNSADHDIDFAYRVIDALAALQAQPAAESPCACWAGRMCSRSEQCARDVQPAAAGVLDALRDLLAAIDNEMSVEWDCNSYHPSLPPALESARAALALAAPAPQGEPVSAALSDIVALWDLDAPLRYNEALHMQAKRALAGEQPVAPDRARWCQYVAGMISGWLEMARPRIMSMGDEARTQAISRIIERRLWAMPKDTAPAPAVPSIDYMALIDAARVRHKYAQGTRACVAFKHGAEWFREQALTAAPTPPAQPAAPSLQPACRYISEVLAGDAWPGEKHIARTIMHLLPIEQAMQATPAVPESADSATPVQLDELAKRNIYDAIRVAYDLGYNDARNARAVPGDSAPGYKGRNVEADHGGALLQSLNQRLRSATAVPEDVAREPMTQRWCWWIGDAETFHIADTESEAHGEARCRIDDDCEPGDTREYSVGRVQHPIDALGVEWLAEHVAETIEENTREWCDDNTGAEDQSITLAAEDKKALGTMVAAFLRKKVSVHWWTADQKTITTHTYVAGSSDDADTARAAEKGGE